MAEATDSAPKSPRAFISYAWSGPTHESWVLNLATRLREDGVDVILDKWDLKPGHEANHFMEQMVRDPSVTKVIMVCDRKYAEKANDRSGGVGVESQIISPEIYASAAQDKYAAVITETDANGKAFVPIFYTGRIYLDFSDPANYEKEYEALLRWIVDKPLHVKPELGAVPEHIAQPTAVAAATLSRLRRAEEAIRQSARNCRPLTREFTETFVSELGDKGIPSGADGSEWDEQVLASLERMRPYLAQFQEIVRAVARFSDDSNVFDELLEGVERAGVLMFRPPERNSWSDDSFDHYRLALWELFLTMIAILLKERRFDLVLRATQKAYLIPNKESSDRATADYTEFFHHIPSLQQRNHRLQLRRTVPQADVLEQHYKSETLSMQDVMQADLVLYLKSIGISDEWSRWYPVTLVFAGRQPFEIFARAESRDYFAQIAPMMGVKTIDELKEVVKGIQERKELRFGHWGVDAFRLANVENLGKVP